MECLGISESDGVVYEGRLEVGFRSQPSPVLIPINFTAFPVPEHAGPVQGFARTIFREDSYDPVTRIRRGRVFSLYDGGQPRRLHVHDPIRHDLPREGWGGGTAQVIDRVFLYSRDSLSDLRRSYPDSSKSTAILGSEPFVEIWKIVSIEDSVHGTPILTLKSYRSLSGLPEVDFDRVPEAIRGSLRETMEHVENSNHRLGAVDVVDRCRGALSVMFGERSGDRGNDLGDAIALVEKMANPPLLACWAGKVANRLHPRGKPNEQYKRGTRTVDEADAQLAVGCLGLVLKEFGFAKTV